MEVIPKANEGDPANAGDQGNVVYDPSALVSRIVDGDRSAESELVHRYRRGVSRILSRLIGQHAVVEDLTQDTFQVTFEKIRRGDLREPASLSGFICNIARNLAMDHFRRASKAEKAETELSRASRSLPDPLDQVLAAEKAAIVRRVLDELRPARDR